MSYDKELGEIQLALIVEVTSMIDTACNSYYHFHGQEEGEDPIMDNFWKREEEARKAFWDKIAKLLKQQDIKSRIDELDNIGAIGADFSATEDSEYRDAVESYIIEQRKSLRSLL